MASNLWIYVASQRFRNKFAANYHAGFLFIDFRYSQSRSSMLEVIHQDYIRTAWSKGLKEAIIIRRHALKNGLIPVITLLGLTIRNLIGGSVIIETIFNIPGIGRFAVTGLLTQDYAVVEGVILVISLVITAINLFVDISYGWIDPRIRLK